MRKYFILIVISLIITCGCKKEVVVASGENRFMGVEEIKPGMKGFGRTVFKGDTIESFDVTIIGVVKNFMPQSDLILAEVHHDITDEGGIIAGMSGSPIYIEGRLIGALAYGWSFQKRPIGGITPIKEMLLEQTEEEEPIAAYHDQSSTQYGPGISIGSYDIMPLSIPLVLTGSSLQFRKFVEEEFKKRFSENVIISAGGTGTGGVSGEGKDIQEGSAIAVKLIEGDFDIAAVGTVTCIEGDTVYAFGHPFSMDGKVSLPMAKAWVHTVITRLDRSFKFSSTGETIGTFVFDYSRGIKGVKGKIPEMLTLVANVENIDTGKSQRYQFKLVHDKRWTPFMTLLALYYSVSASTVVGTDVSAWVESTIEVEGLPLITGKDFFMTSGSPALSSAFSLYFKLYYLMYNEFQPLTLKNISLSLKVARGKRAKIIERYIVDKKKVKPGDEIDIILYLKKYREPVETKKITVRIPENIPEGDIRLNIYNGLYTVMHDLSRAPGLKRAETIEQYARLLSDPYGANTLVIDFNTRDQGVVVNGEEFQDIPSSILRVYKDLSDARFTTTNYKLWKRDTIEQDEVIQGSISIDLTVSKYF